MEAHLFAGQCDVALRFLETKGLRELLALHDQNDYDNYEETDSPNKYWFSWTLFDRTYQTTEFSCVDMSLPKQQDSIRLKYFFRPEAMANYLPTEVLQVFPLKIFLCKANAVIAYTTCDPLLSQVQQGTQLVFPLQQETWQPLQALDAAMQCTASIRLAIDVHRIIDEVEAPVIDVPLSPVAPPLKKDEDDYSLDFEEQKETAKDDDHLRHFRITVEMKALKGLRRPSHLSLQCTYAYLGAHGVIRTPPQWHRANVETKIEKGTISYECATTKTRLREILLNHPMKVAVIERSQLGTVTIGYIHIDLSEVEKQLPFSFRCPVTSRMFKTIDEYKDYREQLVVMYNNHEIERLPPDEPEYIRTFDAYLPVSVVHDSSEEEFSHSNLAHTKLRTVVIFEDKGQIGRETAMKIKRGYKMHNGAVYDTNQDTLTSEQIVDSLNQTMLTNANASSKPANNEINDLVVDWELWRQQTESSWREALQEREVNMRNQMREEILKELENKADDLRRAQQEVGKLEVRLKASIEAIEKQRHKITLQEEQLELRVAQKMQELQLLQRRIRSEAKASIELEQKKNEALEQQLKATQDSLRTAERRAQSAEKDFELLKQQMRNSPESLLREEISSLKAQVAEAKEALEKEKHLRSNVILEREHFRSQMYRLATALKREREKTSAIARQELEQLRLEFLAREER